MFDAKEIDMQRKRAREEDRERCVDPLLKIDINCLKLQITQFLDRVKQLQRSLLMGIHLGLLRKLKFFNKNI